MIGVKVATFLQLSKKFLRKLKASTKRDEVAKTRDKIPAHGRK